MDFHSSSVAKYYCLLILSWVVFFHIHFMTNSTTVVLALCTIWCRNGNKFQRNFQTGKLLQEKQQQIEYQIPDYHIDLQWKNVLIFGKFITCSWTTYQSFHFSCISSQSCVRITMYCISIISDNTVPTLMLKIVFLCHWFWYLTLNKQTLFSILVEC